MAPSKQFFIVVALAFGAGSMAFFSIGLATDSIAYSRSGLTALIEAGADEEFRQYDTSGVSGSGARSGGNTLMSSGGGSSANSVSDAGAKARSASASRQNQNFASHYPENSWTRAFLEHYNQSVEVPLSDYHDIGPDERKEALRSFLERSEVKNELRRFRTYTSKDLTVHDDLSEDAFRRYGNEVAQVFIDNSSPYEETALTIYHKAREYDGETQDALLDELRRTRQRFENIQLGLAALSIPTDAVDVHIDLLNGLSLLEKRTAGMTLFSLDPIRGVINAGGFKAQSKYFVSAYLQLEEYLDEREVTFGQNEPGSTI